VAYYYHIVFSLLMTVIVIFKQLYYNIVITIFYLQYKRLSMFEYFRGFEKFKFHSLRQHSVAERSIYAPFFWCNETRPRVLRENGVVRTIWKAGWISNKGASVCTNAEELEKDSLRGTRLVWIVFQCFSKVGCFDIILIIMCCNKIY